jgi:hypothetical protein
MRATSLPAAISRAAVMASSIAGSAGPPVLYRHHACGEISHVDLRCAHCGEPMHADDVELLPGPGAAVGPQTPTGAVARRADPGVASSAGS